MLNLVQHPWLALSSDAALFCFAQSHKDVAPAAKRLSALDIVAGRTVTKNIGPVGQSSFFVALCLCAKQKGAAMFRVTKGL
jgi:hypothetical protein